MESESSGVDVNQAEVDFTARTDLKMPVLFDSEARERRLVCLEHPAVVQNVDKALETVGGIDALSKTYSQESKRLELRWRPNDFYCKPAYGDRFQTTNLLMKVKRRRKKIKDGSSEAWKVEYKVEIVGAVNTTFRFQGMTDFQYLPVKQKKDGSYENLLDQMILNDFVKRNDFLNRDIPLFLPPLIFSRMDIPAEYMYRPDKVLRQAPPNTHLPTHLIGSVRQRRTIFTIFVNFDEETPSKPQDGAEKVLTQKFKNPELIKIIKKLFEERPIWSKNALRCHVDPKFVPRLRFVLPLVAYYFGNGPWRALWVRFGYDPRSHPSSKWYQIVDFRMRQRGGAERMKITGKRSVFMYKLPTTVSRHQSQVAKIHTASLRSGKEEKAVDKNFQESIYKFRPDVLPPCRQMFYQFCDIEEDQIKKLVSENDGKETMCTEKDGWCIKDITEKCREILFKHVEKHISRDTFDIPYTGSKKKRLIIGKLRGVVEMVSDDESDTEQDGIADEEELNEMETEMLDCV